MRVHSMKSWRMILALAACAAMAACATGPGRIQSPSASGSMLYGSLDLPAQVRDQINWVMIYKLGEVYVTPFKNPIRARFFPSGNFYMENVKPGKYYVNHVVAGFEAFYFYPPDMSEAKAAVLEHTTEVAPGTLTYLGHYRIHDWKRGLNSKMSPRIGSLRLLSSTPGAGPEPIPNFLNHSSVLTAGSGTFSLERTTAKDAERVVLQQVLAEIRGTGWEERIEGRLQRIALAGHD
jgi:hypothetical protein